MTKIDLCKTCENYYECDSNCERCEVYAHYQNTKED